MRPTTVGELARERGDVTSGGSGASTSDDRHMDEWKEARATLSAFDDRVHDLRKYGFTFITALLTADSILIPAAAAGSATVPTVIKLAVFVVTLILILAVRLIHRNYQLFLEAAALRAKILERVLNLELTETISMRHRAEHAHAYESSLYLCFALSAGVLGGTILHPELWAVLLLGVVTAGTMFAIYRIEQIELSFEHRKVDWIVDPIECSPGGGVSITLTNLDQEESLPVPTGVAWEVKTQTGTLVYQEKVTEPRSIAPGDSYT